LDKWDKDKGSVHLNHSACPKWDYKAVDFSSMFRKKIETFSVDEIETLLRGASSSSHTVSVSKFLFCLDTFASVGSRVLKCSKIDHARRMGNFTREITLNNEYLSQFLSDCKVLWMTFKRLVQIFIKFPI